MDQAVIWIPYCGAAPAPGELAARWNLDPVFLAALMLAAAGGWRFASAMGGRRWYLAAIALLAFLFVSPFCALTAALFSARVIHHLALTAVVAPLLAVAFPVSRIPGGLALWTGIHAATFWIWHAPSAYGAALSNHAIYWLMQISLLLTAWALWRGVWRASLPAGIAALLATTVQMGLLGALLTFIGTPLYAPHALGPLAWGLAPLDDQQFAGLIMWVPGAGLYLGAAMALAVRWFAQERAAATT